MSAEQETPDVAMQTGEGAASSSQAPPEKKKRGKPKDPLAPPKPKNGFAQFSTAERVRIKETNPQLASDLGALGKALAEGWAKVPQEEKDIKDAKYAKEMEIWRPIMEEYKKTKHYKDFVENLTDYKDIRQQKKLKKVMTKDAPKRPQSGYMIFGGEVRGKVMEEVKEKGLGLGDAGRLISERWQSLSEAEKARYGEMSAQMKIKFDKEFEVYRTGKSFKEYAESKCKLEAKQGLKKIGRTCLDEAPKKAPSGFALYRRDVMPQITEQNAKAKESGGAVLDMAGIARKVSGMFKELSEDAKKPYAEKAAELGKKQVKDMQAFKTKQNYLKFVEQRSAIKLKENKLLNLREAPKGPKSVFALFADENKDKVEPGKGEGKGRSALKSLFNELSEEGKAVYLSKNAEMKDTFEKAKVEWEKGDTFQTYKKVAKKVREEFENEAVKVTTMKFLQGAPAPAPKTAFAVFMEEKRKRPAEDAADGQKQSKQARREEATKLQAEWTKIDKELKIEYEARRAELDKAFQQQCKDYMASDTWKEYVGEAKRLRIPVRSLLHHQKKVLKKIGKDGKAGPESIPLPQKPDTWPAKVKTSLQFFTAEEKGKSTPLDEIATKWQSLEDKSAFTEKAADDQKRYDTEMEEFQKSDAGKTYFKEYKLAVRRNKVMAAKTKYLGDMPKAPADAVKVYQKSKVNEVKKANPGKKNFELRQILDNMWKGLGEEERKSFEEQVKESHAKFEEAMEAFKKSDNWKKFTLATTVRKFNMKVKKVGKGKGKGKGGGGGSMDSGPARPESYPKRPMDAFKAFCQSSGKSISEAAKLWKELDTEKQEEYQSAAKERAAKHVTDMEAFKKSDEGKKYFRAIGINQKRTRLGAARDKYLKGKQPKKPATAFFLFTNGKREWLKENHPEIKSLPAQLSKFGAMWKEVSDEERAPYTAKAKEAEEEHRKAMEEFKKSADFKHYQSIVNKCTGRPVAKAKAKAAAPSGPVAPENMPKKPSSGIVLFGAEERKKGVNGLKEISAAWTKLGAEGQKPFQDQGAELMKQYEKDMEEFHKTADGKRYNREKEAYLRKGRMAQAKTRYLGGKDSSVPTEPKRPMSAYFVFLNEKRATCSSSKPADVAKELMDQWKTLAAEDKKVYEDKVTEMKKKYEEDIKAYNEHPQVKQYKRALDTISGKKAMQIKAKAKVKAAAAAKVAKSSSGPQPAGKTAGKKKADSDSDVMGSDSDSDSSSSDSDSD